MDTTVPADAAVNVWHFQSSGAAGGTEYDVITSSLETFYNTLAGKLSPAIANGWTVKIYDLADAEPRVPVNEDTINPSPGGLAPLPAELAVCMSYKSAVVSGVPAARRRGRLYLGPLATGVLDSSGMISSDTRTVVTGAATAFADDIGAVAGLTWELYSPTDDIMRRITSVYVDNAFDVQRRRGVDASARTTVVIP